MIAIGDESKLKKLSVAINAIAGKKFQQEGKKVLNLCVSPFDKIEQGKFNEDFLVKKFIQIARNYGHRAYNFAGLSFYKSKYRGKEKQLYFASQSLIPLNDLYLGFLASGIANSYFGLIGKIMTGVVEKTFQKNSKN